MANILWEQVGHDRVSWEQIRGWKQTADTESELLVSPMTPDQMDELTRQVGEGPETIYQSSDGTVAIRWISDKARLRYEKEIKERREILLILQEALIVVSSQNSDQAAKLAARAYVNLKTDPVGQRRFDGLLHRFTGVLHRR